MKFIVLVILSDLINCPNAFIKTSDAGSNSNGSRDIAVNNDIYLSVFYDDPLIIDETQLLPETEVALIKLSSETGCYAETIHTHSKENSNIVSYKISNNNSNNLLIYSNFSYNIDLGDTIIYEEEETQNFDDIIIKVDEGGNRIWFDQIALSSAGGNSNIAFHNDNIIIAGAYNEQVQLGPFILTRPEMDAEYAGYIAKIKDYTYTGMDGSESSDIITIYPNPTAGEIHISLPDSADNYQVETINALGQLIKSDKITNTINFMLDISSQPAGIYFVKIKTGSQIQVKQIIKVTN